MKKFIRSQGFVYLSIAAASGLLIGGQTVRAEVQVPLIVPPAELAKIGKVYQQDMLVYTPQGERTYERGMYQIDTANNPEVNELDHFNDLDASSQETILHDQMEGRLTADQYAADTPRSLGGVGDHLFQQCRDLQMEQVKEALKSNLFHHSKLKALLKDYSQTFGGIAVVKTAVQLDVEYSGIHIRNSTPATPDVRVGEDEKNHELSLYVAPAVYLHYNGGSTGGVLDAAPVCKISSKEDILKIAEAQLKALKARKIDKLKDPNAFRVKDVAKLVNSIVADAPQVGPDQKVASRFVTDSMRRDTQNNLNISSYYNPKRMESDEVPIPVTDLQDEQSVNSGSATK